MLISILFKFTGKFSGTLFYRAKKEAAAWGKLNETRQIYRYGLLRRFQNWGNEHPFLFSFWICTCAALFAFTATAYFPQADAPSWLAQVRSLGIKFPSVSNTNMDLAAFTGVPWTVQATIVALVYPIVLSFITLLLQRKAHSMVLLRVYLIESAVLPAGISSVALLVVLGIQYFMTPYANITESEPLFSFVLVTDATWLILNIVLTGLFLTRTIRFIQEEEQQRAFKRQALNIALQTELHKALIKNLYVRAPADDWKLSGADSDDLPIITTVPFTLGGKIVSIALRRKYVLTDVRLNLLRFVARRWHKRAIGFGRPQPTLLFNPKIGGSYSGEVVLCSILNGPSLTRVEQYLVNHAFIFRRERSEAKALSTQLMLEELAAEVRVAIEQRKFEAAVDAIQALTTFHNLLLKASAVEINGVSESTAMLSESPGSFFTSDSFDHLWVRPYRDLNRLAVASMENGDHLLRRLSAATEAITRDVATRPEKLHINAMRVGSNLAFELGRWWLQKVDEIMLPGTTEFSGVLPPRLNKSYDRGMLALIGYWGNLNFYYRPPTSGTAEAQWDANRGRVLIYTKHIEDMASIFITAVSRRDITASRRLLDSFLKWWGTRQYGFRFTDNVAPYKSANFTISIAYLNWTDAYDKLWDGRTPLTPDLANNALFIALQRYWEDMRIYLSLHLINSAGYRPKMDSLEVNLAAMLISGRALYDGGTVKASKLRSIDQAMAAIIRAAFSTDGNQARINAFAEDQRESRKRELEVPGWSYGWSSIDSASIESMQTAHAILLMSIAPEFPHYSSLSKRQVESWLWNVDKHQEVERYLDSLRELMTSPEFYKNNSRTIKRLREKLGNNHKLNKAMPKSLEMLSSLAATARHERLMWLSALSVDASRIESLRVDVSQQLFELSEFPEYIKNIVFSPGLTAPPTNGRMSEQRQQFLEIVGHGHNSNDTEISANQLRFHMVIPALFKKIQSEGIAAIPSASVYEDFESSESDRLAFVIATADECNRLRNEGQEPIILVGQSYAGHFLSPGAWLILNFQLPKGVTFTPREGLGSELPRYCLNGAPIIETETPEEKVYVLPASTISTFYVSGKSAADALSLTWTDADSETLSLQYSCSATF